MFLGEDKVDNPPQKSVQPPNNEEVAPERRKSDTESVNSDKQVAEWIEDQQRARTNKPYREQHEKQQQADSLRSKSESNITGTGRPKSCPPPIAPKPSMMSSKVVILNRNANEGFGFVIISSPVAKGSVIGKIRLFILLSEAKRLYRYFIRSIFSSGICIRFTFYLEKSESSIFLPHPDFR